jgi:glutamate/tyrosine decarboxylase-like PLP-dependent enzyme
MPLHPARPRESDEEYLEVRPEFASDLATRPLPRLRLPEHATAPRVAYQLVHDELLLDGNPRLNLATFVTTWMEPEARALMDASVDRNLVDKDEYPQTAELERRCVSMLADLWGDDPRTATGCSTTGSSEACMLAGLALERRWRARAGGSGQPNLVMGANVQVCWEKFCRYWDVEARMVPVGHDATHLTPEGAVAACDENTIGVVAILGSEACRDTARWVAQQVGELGPFALISDGSQLPVFAFRLRDDVERYSVYDVSEAVRKRGWVLPAYAMPQGLEHVHVLRIVVRNGFGRDLAHTFMEDLGRAVKDLEAGGGRVAADGRAGFHH